MNHEAFSQVTIVVVTYNSAHCLPMLAPLLSVCPNVVISDNGSDDDTAINVKALLPHAKLLAHGRNLGFGAANNRALDQVETPFALLLNPDCEMTPQALQELLAAAEDFNDAAVLAPQLMASEVKAEVNYRWPTAYWLSRGPAAEGPLCVGFVCGAVMLLRMERMAMTGFFDEQFFLYYEDDDLCLRLFQAKLPMVLCPQVKVLHRSRGSVRGKSPWRSEYLRGYHHAQSKLIFLNKHESLQAAKRLQRQLIWTTTLALPLRVILFSPKLVARMWGRLRGLLEWNAS
ncbi:MAG: glycosyltransferase family 2 protein [Limnohabitans sp.]|jgi:N-acetylglucosaminyl-diphospho-decaprenol L-rhamnosyltransferase|nr:glycosyltransferase family 2 protein [Limnohabitans sp.]